MLHLWSGSINFSAAPDLHDPNNFRLAVDLVENSIVAHSDASIALRSGQLTSTVRMQIAGQRFNVVDDMVILLPWKALEVSLCRALKGLLLLFLLQDWKES